jgi:imidazoleglycerol-phosphate dehydratase
MTTPLPSRTATVDRSTTETQISVAVDLAGGERRIATGVGFFDHMLDQLARHSGIGMRIAASGDRHIDDHHTVEDVGIALGRAIDEALGDKRGIVRYADCLLPMDETLTRVAIDLSGRPFLVFRAAFHAPKIGSFDTQLVREFFTALAMNGRMTLHIETLYGDNDHHIAESIFKGVARALGQATRVAMPDGAIPSTKGAL